jgi:hypothetical protein
MVEPEMVGRRYLEDLDRNYTVEATGESEKKMENSRSGGFGGGGSPLLAVLGKRAVFWPVCD